MKVYLLHYHSRCTHPAIGDISFIHSVFTKHEKAKERAQVLAGPGIKLEWRESRTAHTHKHHKSSPVRRDVGGGHFTLTRFIIYEIPIEGVKETGIKIPLVDHERVWYEELE